MRIHDYTLPSFYSPSLRSDDAFEERTVDLESAAHHNLWLLALGILQSGPTDPARRDVILLDAMSRLEEGVCLNWVKAVRAHGPLPAKTDSRILEIAAERNFQNLADLQLQWGLIQPWGADSALRIAAESNHRLLVTQLLDSPFCSQRGKNLAALGAAERGALGVIQELLAREAVSGNYVQDSYRDRLNNKTVTECICSRLLYVASKKGYWEIADKVATYKAEKLRLELSKADLTHLAVAAAGAGQVDFLQELLKLLGDLDFYDRQKLLRAAEMHGHYDLLPLLDPSSEDSDCQNMGHRRCHSH